MEIVKMAKAMIPLFHATMDDAKMYHLGCTWISEDGLTDRHNVEIRYTRNSEELAVKQGEEQLDGSWMFEEPNGTKHTISKARFDAYVSVKKKHADQYEEIKSRMKTSGIDNDIVDAQAAPA
jgi:hypothetical protein